jgi:hypothetical protein
LVRDRKLERGDLELANELYLTAQNQRFGRG